MLIVNDINPVKLLVHQLKSFYFVEEQEISILSGIWSGIVKEKLENCFLHINNKYYGDDGYGGVFNPYHTSQWTMFLYYMAHETGCNINNYSLADRIYGLSKCFSSADLFYEVRMPDIWFFDHPQGSVMGRAAYSDYFSFTQGCTIGNNKGRYPVLDSHVTMFSDAKIIGDCHIGSYVIISANSYIKDMDIPSCSIVYGQFPKVIVKSISKEKFVRLTGSIFKYKGGRI